MKIALPSKYSVLYLVSGYVVAATLLVTATFTFFVFLHIDRTMSLLRSRTLSDQAADISSYLERTDDGTLFLDLPLKVRNFYAGAGKYHQYLVRGPTEEILFTSPIAFTHLYPNPHRGNEFFNFTGPQGTHYIGAGTSFAFDGETYYVQVVQNQASADEYPDFLTEVFLRKLVMTELPFTLFILAAIAFALHRSFAPIRKASEQAKTISYSKPGQRLSEKGMPAEFLPFVQAVNEALARLERGIEGQKEFSANAAHELRTPLSILRSNVDTLEDPALARRLREDVDLMIRLVNQLLAISRLDFPEALDMDTFDLAETVKEACSHIWPLFLEEDRPLDVTGIDEPVFIKGSEEAIYRVIRNLLENTLRHTKPHGRVQVQLDGRKLSVIDEGPQIPREQRATAFRRFHRGDRKGRPSSGAGLGLAIVKQTMDLHGGSVELVGVQDGNAFVLTFPQPARETGETSG